MMNLSAIIGYQIAAPLSERFDYPTLFLIAAVFETLIIATALFIDPDETRGRECKKEQQAPNLSQLRLRPGREDSPGRSRTDVPRTKTRDDGPLHYRTVVSSVEDSLQLVSPITLRADSINSLRSRPCFPRKFWPLMPYLVCQDTSQISLLGLLCLIFFKQSQPLWR